MKHFYHFIYPVVGPYNLNTWFIKSKCVDGNTGELFEKENIFRYDSNYTDYSTDWIYGPFSEEDQAISFLKNLNFNYENTRHYFTLNTERWNIYEDDEKLLTKDVMSDVRTCLEDFDKFNVNKNLSNWAWEEIYSNRSEYFTVSNETGPAHDEYYNIIVEKTKTVVGPFFERKDILRYLKDNVSSDNFYIRDKVGEEYSEFKLTCKTLRLEKDVKPKKGKK